MTPEYTEVDCQRSTFRAKLAELGRAGLELRELSLPDFWEHPDCCDAQSLQVVEPGYWRWESVDEAGIDGNGVRVFHASTDGWDSMSEHGTRDYIECQSCGAEWETPVELDWD